MPFKKLLEAKSEILQSVGFYNPLDFLCSIFGNKETSISFATIAVAFSTFIAIISNIIDTYIFSPALGIWLLFILTGADILLGLASSKIIKKESPDPWKMSRAGIRFIAQVFFVFALFQMSKVWEDISKWSVDALLFMFVIVTFWSAFKNAYKLKLVPEEVYQVVEQFLSVGKLFERVFGKFVQLKIEEKKNDVEQSK